MSDVLTCVQPSSDDGPEGWIEARLDLLLAQECASDPDFTTWLVGHVGLAPPTGASLASTRAEISVFDNDDCIPAEAIGETDVRLTLTWSDGSTNVVLIEDKVWAEFQPRQMERYRMRCEAIGAQCLLVAPKTYLSRSGCEAKQAHGMVPLEEIVAKIAQRGDARSQWTSDYLTDLIAPKSRKVAESDPATVAFTDHCVAWCEDNAPHVVPQRLSLHTLGQGWLFFESRPELIYKVVGLRSEDEAFVDLYTGRKSGSGPAPGSIGPIDGFTYDVDTADNVLLRYRCPKVDPHAGSPISEEDRRIVADALAACRRAVDLVLSDDWASIAAGRV